MWKKEGFGVMNGVCITAVPALHHKVVIYEFSFIFYLFTI
jgi:hypothetical protein